MKIQSTFRDYYDCMQAYGQDPMIVYRRTPEAILIKGQPKEPANTRYWWQEKDLPTCVPRSVGFCGKWYQYFVIYASGWESKVIDTVYSLEEIDKWIEDNAKKGWKEDYYGTKPKWDRRRIGLFTRETIVDSIKKFGEYTSGDDQFIRYGAPVIINHEQRWFDNKHFYTTTLNGSLENIKFFKVFEPWQAYQELSMYVGCQLVDRFKKIPKLDDKTMAEIKGFDKYSFRKDKAQK